MTTSFRGPAAHNYSATFILANFGLAYLALAPRTLKQYYGVNHNSAPQDDIAKYGEAAVREGKMTRAQLDMVKRNAAAEWNAIAHYPFFCASVLFGLHAGLPAETMNVVGAVYTFSRIAYGIFYIVIDRDGLAVLRSTAWWVSNLVCMWTLWQSGNAINARDWRARSRPALAST